MSGNKNKKVDRVSDASILCKAALAYHACPTPGKISIVSTKQLSNWHDLSLAYSPGVGTVCLEIMNNQDAAFQYTSRAHLVGVISNGTAVLGFGDIGPLASKPVMEGKAVLFKKFAGLDAFDIEIQEKDPDKLIDIIASLEPTFGAINLEDIRSPDCFYIEQQLRKRMSIPVFHDDQHGTAVVVAAAVLNGLRIVGKSLSDITLVCSGAGAAALSCLDLLIYMGLSLSRTWVADVDGLLYVDRPGELHASKKRFAHHTHHRTLDDVCEAADVFIGLSVGGVFSAAMVKKMADRPLIFALANPVPEIFPEEVQAVRTDAITATGRADYPNQVNNILCFPFIFRGAMDVGATTINRAMEIAAVNAIAKIARLEHNDSVLSAYESFEMTFGPEYILPKPFDPRLMLEVASAVAQAALDTGVARRPFRDITEYRNSLQRFIDRSETLMYPLSVIAKSVKAKKKRIVFAEGEEDRVLFAVQVIVDQGIAHPILVGRPTVIARTIKKLGLRIIVGQQVDIIDSQDDTCRDYERQCIEFAQKKGVRVGHHPATRGTLLSAAAVYHNRADGMVCGCYGTPLDHLPYIDVFLGKKPDASLYAAINGLIIGERHVFLVDTHVNIDPTAEEIVEITLLAVQKLRDLGIQPNVALLSHSQFGSRRVKSSIKMKRASMLLKARDPSLAIDGEMNGDVALDIQLRKYSSHTYQIDEANLLVFPNLDAANISYNLLKTTAGYGVAVGPILLGVARPAHIMTSLASVRRIINLAVLVVVDAVISDQ